MNDKAASHMVGELLATYQGPLYGFLRGLVSDADDARDLTQESFVEAWQQAIRGRPPFDHVPDPAAVRRWLFHVAYCRAVSALRRRHPGRSLSLETLTPSEHPAYPDDFTQRIADDAAVRRAVRDLGSEDAACLLLNVVEGFSASAIAPIIGISPEAAKKRVARAKQRLRAMYFSQNPLLSQNPHAVRDP